MMPYKHTKFWVKNHQGAGSVSKKFENPENLEKLSLGGGGCYWGGRPLGDNSTYLLQHRRDITQTFVVDSTNDTHKVSGRNSPRRSLGGQKSLENLKAMKSCLSDAPGRALARTRAERGRIAIEPENHRAIAP